MNTLTVIDTHTGGEPTRVIVDGLPENIYSAKHGPVSTRANNIKSNYDWIRTSLCNEPRGSEVMVGAALIEPSNPDCDFGIVFFNNVCILGMCGHGTIGAIIALQYENRVQRGAIKFETPVGVIEATLHDDGRTVTLDNVPSFRYATNIPVELLELKRTIHGDIAWGGNWFFLCADHGIPVNTQQIPALQQMANSIQAALQRMDIKGDTEYLDGIIDHIELFDNPTDPETADSKSFVLCPGNQYDRSPCGTGTSAKIACLSADNLLEPGDLHRQESVIGSIFEATYQPSEIVGKIIPTISGKAWVNGKFSVLFDPTDPFAQGIPL